MHDMTSLSLEPKNDLREGGKKQQTKNKRKQNMAWHTIHQSTSISRIIGKIVFLKLLYLFDPRQTDNTRNAAEKYAAYRLRHSNHAPA